MRTIDYRKVGRGIKMCTFIGVECLAANALIELYENEITKIGFKQLAEYGLSVVEQYKKESGTDAVLIFDPEDIHGLVINYSDFFDIEETEQEQKYLCLKNGVEIRELKEQFRWTLSYAMLKAISRVSAMKAVNN